MSRVRLIPHPDLPPNTVGIPREGEMFEPEDAERLIGQGIAVRKPPKQRRRKSKPAPSPAPAEG